MPWPALQLAGAWIIAWQMNLQHEIIHGHPTPSRAGQRRHRHMAAVAVAALLDLSHDPSAPPSGRQSDRSVRGSGELLLDDGGMARPRPLGRAVARAQSTLLGRIVLGPAWMIGRVPDATSPATPGAARTARAPSSPGTHPVRSGADLGHRRLRHAGLGLCRLLRLSGHESGDGSLLRRASGSRRSRRSARRSSRTRAFSGRCSSTTTCMSPITCAAACPGTRYRRSTGSTARR